MRVYAVFGFYDYDQTSFEEMYQELESSSTAQLCVLERSFWQGVNEPSENDLYVKSSHP